MRYTAAKAAKTSELAPAALAEDRGKGAERGGAGVWEDGVGAEVVAMFEPTYRDCLDCKTNPSGKEQQTKLTIHPQSRRRSTELSIAGKRRSVDDHIGWAFGEEIHRM